MMKKIKFDSAFSLFSASFLFWFSLYAFSSYLNPEMERMGASATLMGLAGSAYGLAQLVSRLPFGLVSASSGKQKIFVCIGCAMALLSLIGMEIFYTPVGLLVFRAMQGAAAGTWVCFTVLYGSYFKKEDVPAHITTLDMVGHLGKLVCFILLLFVTTRWGCRSSLALGIGAMAIGFLLSLTVRETNVPGQKVTWGSIKEVIQDKNLIICTVLAALSQFVQCGTYLSFSQNLAARLNADAAQLTGMSIILLVPTVLFNLLGNHVLVPRIGAKRTVIIGFLMGQLYCVTAPVCKSIFLLYLCQILAAGNTGLVMSQLMGLCVRDLAPEQRTAGMTIFQTLFSVGTTLGPIFVGAMADASSLHTAFLCAGFVCIAGWALALFFLKDSAKGEQA